MSDFTVWPKPMPAFTGTPAQLLFAFGCIEHAPYAVAARFPPGWQMAATAFRNLQDIALARGFTKLQRRQLKGAARRGKATPFAMDLAEAAVDLIEPAEIALQIGRTASWLNYFEHGRPLQGWTFRTPDG